MACSYTGQRTALTRLLRAKPIAEMEPGRKVQLPCVSKEAVFAEIACKVALALERLREEDNAATITFVGLHRLQRGLVDLLGVMQRAKSPINACEPDFA
ncbi:Mitochondrial tRNAs modification protein [Rhodotorula kratochvilovae]